MSLKVNQKNGMTFENRFLKKMLHYWKRKKKRPQGSQLAHQIHRREPASQCSAPFGSLRFGNVCAFARMQMRRMRARGPEPSHFSPSASWLSRHALCHIQPLAQCVSFIQLSLPSHPFTLSSFSFTPFPHRFPSNIHPHYQGPPETAVRDQPRSSQGLCVERHH